MSSWGLFMLASGAVAVGGVALAAMGQRAAGAGPSDVGPAVRAGLVVMLIGLAMLIAGVAAQFVMFRSAFAGD